jgi:hypothetical protein
MTNATHHHRFDIALSFPGEHRRFVKNVATRLGQVLGKQRVFYDEWYEAELLGLDGDLKLRRYYREESALVVPFFSEHYEKDWCQIEWSAIRAMLKTRRQENAVIPVQLDGTRIAGWEEIDFAIRKKGRSAREIADLILEAYRHRFSAFVAPPNDSPNTEISNVLVSSSTSPRQIKADISRIIKYAPAELIGREDETALLNDVWAKAQRQEKPRPHISTFVALGGEGKTSLVAKWAAELAAQGWPGCDVVFAWSFYSQGTREQVAASSDLFLKAALDFFGDDDDQAFAASAAGAYEKGERLARVVARRRCLLILDGLEPLQYAPSAPTPGELKDQGVAALLKKLAADNRGLCVVTTRYALPDLRAFLKQTVREEPLLRLSRAAGVHLLKTLGVRGSELRNLPLKDGDAQSEKVNEFEKLVEDVKGHALTLMLLGGFLHDAHGGDIRKRDLMTLAEADAESEHPNHAAHVMDAYVKWFESGGQTAEEIQRGRRSLAMLRLMGLFDRPATADCLQALWQLPVIEGLTEPLFEVVSQWAGLKKTYKPISEAQRNLVLKRLEAARLLTVNRDAAGTLVALDAHPHLREYFAKRLKEGMKDEGGMMKEKSDSSLIPHPSSFQLAHRRLYEHLCATTKEGDRPTLEDLQPLYQAVAHGCQAGLQQETYMKVYWERLTRKTDYYSVQKLGAFASDLGAVACFFEQPWNRPLSHLNKDIQAGLLSQTAFYLRALGRLPESLEPMRAGFENYIEQKRWMEAAITASNLSELELTLGEVAGAVGDAEQSVTYADRSGEAFQQMVSRTIHADALHQAGRWTEAEVRFREAEQMQAERQPDYPLLYSQQGFRYCDLLLAPCERASLGKTEGGKQKDEWIAACRAVSHRAAQMLKLAEQYLGRGLGLHDIALAYLTLGRAAFYEALLADTSLAACRASLDQAVASLRRAGQQWFLPHGLLTRAWFRSRSGVPTGPDSAQTDLDEAWEIAVRGPMRLFMADIHLYRARLFGGMRDEGGGMKEPYPWESVAHDLAEAERLIKECGYHRRDEELADAKRALLGEASA